MPICKDCEETYTQKRFNLGYRTCLECGEFNATIEKNRKSKCVATAFNKGAYTYVYSKKQAKNIGR